MRTRRIELEGRAGHVAIERQRGTATIRIDSIISDPRRGQEAWKTWEIAAGASPKTLRGIACVIQQRCDGQARTSGDIDNYYRELQRFAD